MTEQPPAPPSNNGRRNGRTFIGELGDAIVALAKGIASQPAVASLFGALLVLLIINFMLAREERKDAHLELNLMLDRCLPNVIRGSTSP